MPTIPEPTAPATGGRGGSDTQRQILAATAQLIMERGYRATTLKAVSKAVGISEPAIYKHFANRGDVMAAVFAAAMKLIPMSRLAREGRSKLEQITELPALLTDPDRYAVRRLGVEMHTAAALEDEYSAIVAAHNDRHANGLREMIRAAIAAGSASGCVDIGYTQWYIHVLMIGLSHQDTLRPQLVGDPRWRAFVIGAVRGLFESPPPRTAAPAALDVRPLGRPLERETSTPARGRARSRRDGADTRRRILQEAALLIASHGYHGTTMKLVAARVGISEPAVYRHFENKARLMAAVFSATGQRTSYREMVLTGQWDPAVIPTYVTLLCRADMHLVRRLAVEMLATAPLDAEVHAIATTHVARVAASLRAVLDDGVATGALPTDTEVDLMVWYVLVVMLGLSHLETLSPELIGDPGWSAFVYGAIGTVLG